jgi:hypothetical protein
MFYDHVAANISLHLSSSWPPDLHKPFNHLFSAPHWIVPHPFTLSITPSSPTATSMLKDSKTLSETLTLWTEPAMFTETDNLQQFV